MVLDLQAAATEYLGWLQLEANRSPNTVRAYESELRKLIAFLAANGHNLVLNDVRHEDLRAYQRHLAGRLKSPASRARALVAIRSWLRWLAKEGLIERDLSNGITLPKLGSGCPSRSTLTSWSGSWQPSQPKRCPTNGIAPLSSS